MVFALQVVIGLLVLSALVFIHELGHFLAAKALKFKVSAFALGFGKPIFKVKRGETEYRINAIPFGGYVAMAGDSPVGETAGGDNEFNCHPILHRAAVAVAGPAANFVFAVLMLWGAFINGIERPVFMDSSKIGGVISGSPADSAGFADGDSILTINGEPTNTWEQVEMRLAHQLENHEITVMRGGEVIRLNLHTEKTGARFPKHFNGGILPSQLLPPVVGRVMPRSSAENILQTGDTILTINNIEAVSFSNLSAIVRDYDPESGPVSLNIKRGAETMNLLIIPSFDSTSNRYLLGIGPAPEPTRIVKYSPIEAFGPTMVKTWEYTTMIFDVLGKLTSGKVPAQQLAGPLNIIPISGIMAFQGLSSILNFMALIGINLAILNLLPLVITDGGLLMFLLIEAIRGKPLPAETQALINKIFVALFIALFVFVSFNDIQRLPDFLRMR